MPRTVPSNEDRLCPHSCENRARVRDHGAAVGGAGRTASATGVERPRAGRSTSASPCEPCAATSNDCASSATRSSPSPGSPAATDSASAAGGAAADARHRRGVRRSPFWCGPSTQSVGDAAERAIAKLEQMVPSHLRRDIELSSTVIRVASPIDDVDSSILRTVSAACRASDELAVRVPRPQRPQQRAPAAPPSGGQHRPALVSGRSRCPRARMAHLARRSHRVGGDRPGTACRRRPARCGGARPALDQHRAVSPPGTDRARRAGRAHRRAACPRPSACSRRSTRTRRCSPPAPTNSTISPCTWRCSTSTSACSSPRSCARAWGSSPARFAHGAGVPCQVPT